MKIPWDQCPLNAIQLADCVEDLLEEYENVRDDTDDGSTIEWNTWIYSCDEEEIVTTVGAWWDGLSEEEQEKLLRQEEQRLRTAVEAVNRVLDRIDSAKQAAQLRAEAGTVSGGQYHLLVSAAEGFERRANSV